MDAVHSKQASIIARWSHAVHNELEITLLALSTPVLLHTLRHSCTIVSRASLRPEQVYLQDLSLPERSVSASCSCSKTEIAKHSVVVTQGQVSSIAYTLKRYFTYAKLLTANCSSITVVQISQLSRHTCSRAWSASVWLYTPEVYSTSQSTMQAQHDNLLTPERGAHYLAPASTATPHWSGEQSYLSESRRVQQNYALQCCSPWLVAPLERCRAASCVCATVCGSFTATPIFC